VATMSPARNVGSLVASNGAKPSASRPLQVQLAISAVEVGIALAVARRGVIDAAAEEHFGLARWAHRPASLDRRRVGHVLERDTLAEG